MREKEIEKKLTQMVKKAGGICPKLVSPGFDGMPDRMVLLPNGRIGFVEVKALGEKPRPLQLSRHRLLRRLGFPVYVLDDTEQIGGILDEIRTSWISEICGGLHWDTPRSRYLLRLRPGKNQHHADSHSRPAVWQLRGP